MALTDAEISYHQSAGDESFSNCVECGDRPWGHGYCGELCSVCARRAEIDQALNT